ncbi:hypothetical protein KPATCC21470_8517 [Kitasatospora purpeofusca]
MVKQVSMTGHQTTIRNAWPIIAVREPGLGGHPSNRNDMFMP